MTIQPSGVEAKGIPFCSCIFGESLENASGLIELESQVIVANNGYDDGLIEEGAELILAAYQDPGLRGTGSMCRSGHLGVGNLQ